MIVNPRHVRLSIGTTGVPIKEWLETFSGLACDRVSLTSTGKQFWSWRVNRGVDVLALLVAAEPYLTLKQERARNAIALLRAATGIQAENRKRPRRKLRVVASA